MGEKRLVKRRAWVTGLTIIAVVSLTLTWVYRQPPGRPPQRSIPAAASLDLAQSNQILRLVRLFPSASRPVQTFDRCIVASPVLVESQGEPFVLVAASEGTIAAIDPKIGVTAWSLQVPTPAQHLPYPVATPVRVA